MSLFVALRKRRSKRDRGAALVEFAFVAPVMFLLLMGTIEFAMQLNDYQSVRSGLRDAVRVASVDRVPTDCNASSSKTDDLVCYVRQRIGVSGTTAVRVVVTAPVVAIAGDKGTVKVCAERPYTSLTRLLAPFFANRYMRSEVTMRVERGTAPAYVNYADAAPSGSWTC